LHNSSLFRVDLENVIEEQIAVLQQTTKQASQFVTLENGQGKKWKSLSSGFDQFQLGEQLAQGVQSYGFHLQQPSPPFPTQSSSSNISNSNPTRLAPTTSARPPTPPPAPPPSVYPQASGSTSMPGAGLEVPTSALEQLSMSDLPSLPGTRAPDILELAATSDLFPAGPGSAASPYPGSYATVNQGQMGTPFSAHPPLL
jgi:hypothetical protein